MFVSRWRCPVVTCRKSVGLRDGTFFVKCRLTLRQWIVLVGTPVSCEWCCSGGRPLWHTPSNKSCKTFCLPWAYAGKGIHRSGRWPQDHQSLEVHPYSVVASYRCPWSVGMPVLHSSDLLGPEVWVFGMVDTSQSPALGVMVTVPDRSAQTLLPIMQRHLRSGTKV